MLVSLRVFLTFSSIKFSVSGFMLRSLIHFELKFVQGDKYGSIWLSLHVTIQVDRYHLLKMLSFSQYLFLASLSNSVSPSVLIYVFIPNDLSMCSYFGYLAPLSIIRLCDNLYISICVAL